MGCKLIPDIKREELMTDLLSAATLPPQPILSLPKALFDRKLMSLTAEIVNTEKTKKSTTDVEKVNMSRFETVRV